MNRELPKGWVEIELGVHVYIAGRIGWRGLTAKEYTQSGPYFLSVPNLNYGDEVDFRGAFHISQERYEESPEIQLVVGDILLVKDGAGIGKIGYVTSLQAPATVNSSLLVVRPKDDLLAKKYLFYFLKCPKFQEIALQRISGSATPHLFQKDIKTLRLLAPPLSEQQRIVAKLEVLLGKVDACSKRLEKIPVILKRFRQSVLAAACSGRLTADWRTIVDGQELNESSADDYPELPSSWKWRRIGDLFTVETGTTPPKDDPLNYSDYPTDCPFFKPTDMNVGANVREAREWLSHSGEALARVLPALTTCVTSIGATIGKTGMLRVRGATNQQINAILPCNEVIPAFMFHYCCSQYFQKRIIEESSSTTLPIINKSRFKGLEFPMPPLPEQNEIVRRVDTLFAVADQIETRYAKAKTHVDRLTQSILAKAFRGDLVPQDPNDEPASVLLERIRLQRQETGAARSQPRRKGVMAAGTAGIR